MSTELNHVVQSMSQVSIPQEILNKVDMKNLLKGFSDDYKKLDDLKAARARHEDRNFVSRWWNNDELEDAQLDAAELQASFSKKLGQLMVISVAQSQQLHQQQNGLSEQQQVIKKLDDGGLLLSSRITHHTQILPLVRYWIPHLKIVSPEGLQDEMELRLKEYLGIY